MKEMNRKPFRIGVFFTLRSHASREQVAGVFRFVGEHPDWELHLFERPEGTSGYDSLAETFKPDGILTGHPDAITVFRRRLRRHIPGVVLDFNDPKGRHIADAVVMCDECEIGETAAVHFLSRGFRHFAFAGIEGEGDGDTPVRRSQKHEEGFRRRLARDGFGFSSYRERLIRCVRHYSDLERLTAFLRDIPTPCALFATSDMIAQSVVFACRKIGISVPERLVVLGVNDEGTVCENTTPTLSSIAPDYVGAGYRAAEILDKLLRCGKAPRKTSYGVRRIVDRMSTQNVAGSHRRLALARELIRTKAFEGIRAKEIAEAVGVSPRMLEYMFRKMTGSTVREELSALRLAEARRLLKNTKLPLREVATKCGFRTFSALKSIFLRQHGLSPRTYRKSADPDIS